MVPVCAWCVCEQPRGILALHSKNSSTPVPVLADISDGYLAYAQLVYHVRASLYPLGSLARVLTQPLVCRPSSVTGSRCDSEDER
jgi:hypothetical protein